MMNECTTCRHSTCTFEPTVACGIEVTCCRNPQPDGEGVGTDYPCPLWEPRGETATTINDLQRIRDMYVQCSAPYEVKSERTM